MLNLYPIGYDTYHIIIPLDSICCIPMVVIIDSILQYLIHYLDIPVLGEQIPKEGSIQYA